MPDRDGEVMISVYGNKEECCGCTACENICPKQAITMIEDKEGFLYPQIDDNKCIECGLCIEVCAFNKNYDKSKLLESPEVYGVKHKVFKERITSRSGGMFVAISDYIFDVGGVVYGAGYADDLKVYHKRASNKGERVELKGSKYVQSDMEDVFSQVKEDLKAEKYVLFSGTPCQTAGLKSFIQKAKIDSSRLYLCDIVCHGAPSPAVYRDYLAFIANKYCSKVTGVDFRDKSFGWNTHVESLYLESGKKITNKHYTNLFYQHITLRPACGSCHYTNFQRPSDITLADFWGVEKCNPDFNDNKGVSLVLINTKKGKELFREAENYVEYFKSNTEECLQPNLQKPTKISYRRNEFWKDYERNGFMYILKKYVGYGVKGKIIRKVKSLGRKILRK